MQQPCYAMYSVAIVVRVLVLVIMATEAGLTTTVTGWLPVSHGTAALPEDELRIARQPNAALSNNAPPLVAALESYCKL